MQTDDISICRLAFHESAMFVDNGTTGVQNVDPIVDMNPYPVSRNRRRRLLLAERRHLELQ